jgi:hypothetical protein
VFTLLIYLGQTVSPLFLALFVTDTAVRGAFFAASAIAVIPFLFAVYMRISGPLQSRGP